VARYTHEGGSLYHDLVSMKRGGASYYLLFDGLGSVTEVVDGSENTQNSYRYEAWGQVQSSSENVTNPYRYVGAYGVHWDSSPALYLMGARYYSASVGRFITKDIFLGMRWQPLSFHRYLYVMNNPAMLVDPAGFGWREETWWGQLTYWSTWREGFVSGYTSGYYGCYLSCMAGWTWKPKRPKLCDGPTWTRSERRAEPWNLPLTYVGLRSEVEGHRLALLYYKYWPRAHPRPWLLKHGRYSQYVSRLAPKLVPWVSGFGSIMTIWSSYSCARECSDLL